MAADAFQIRFETADPYDHVPRMLDALRRLDFGLVDLRIAVTEAGAQVSLAYASGSFAKAAAFERQLRRFAGVSAFVGSAAG